MVGKNENSATTGEPVAESVETLGATSAAQSFSRTQIVILVLAGVVWAGLNWLWVHASGDVGYLHDDSISYLVMDRQMQETFQRTPWWQWEIPVSPPPFMHLFLLAIAPCFTDALHSGVSACCFTVQATIVLATYACVAWLGRSLYSPRAGMYSALLFLSFYMVENTVRTYQCDGLLGMMVTIMVAISWQMRRHRYSWGWCTLWALGLILSFACKWSALWQWLGLFFLYHVFLLGREYTHSLPGNRWSRWGRVLGEVLLWVALGLALASAEYALELSLRMAVFIAAVGIVGLRPFLQTTLPLRRFLIISGLVLAVCALWWWLAQADCYFQNVVSLNSTYSGSLFGHILNDWPGLVLSLIMLMLGAVLLPFAGTVALGCSAYCLVRHRRWLPNVEMLCLIIIPSLCINAFFFNAVKARFFMAILGLLAVIIGSVLAESRAWLRWPVLGWCLLAKIVFLGGWLVSPDLPDARDCYLQSSNMAMQGIVYREDNLREKLGQYAKMQSSWSSSPLFTSYPYRLPDMDFFYRVWEKQAQRDDALPAHVLVATLRITENNVNSFHGDYYTLEEIMLRRSPQHLVPAGVYVNSSLFEYQVKELAKARSLVVLYTVQGTPEQRLLAVKRHVRTYFGSLAQLTEVQRSGGEFDCAVFRLAPGWEETLGPLFSQPPTPLLSKVKEL